MSDPRVIVLTGGTGGLGTAVVKRLAGRDYRFAVTYLVPEEARRFEKEVGVDEERLMLSRIDAQHQVRIWPVASFGAVTVRRLSPAVRRRRPPPHRPGLPAGVGAFDSLDRVSSTRIRLSTLMAKVMPFQSESSMAHPGAASWPSRSSG